VEEDEDLGPGHDAAQGRVHGLEPPAQARGERGRPLLRPGDTAEALDERGDGLEPLADVADEDRQAELGHALDEPEGIAAEGDDEPGVEGPDDLDIGIDQAADLADGRGPYRVVAEAGHAGDAVAQAEGEEGLGDVRGQGHDALRRPRREREGAAEVVGDDLPRRGLGPGHMYLRYVSRVFKYASRCRRHQEERERRQDGGHVPSVRVP